MTTDTATNWTTKGRKLIVTVDGNRYEIPDMWLVGFCRDGRTIQDAIAHWHEQEILAR